MPGFAAEHTAHAFRMAGDATRVRVLAEFEEEPDFRWFLLRGPHRLVIELPETRFAFDPAALEPRGLVTGIRYGKLSDGHSRMIVEAKGPFAVENIEVLKNESAPGYRLVADIVATSTAEFDAALAEQAQTTGSTRTTAKTDRIAMQASSADRRFTLVIDPGHGGIDTGAKSAGGTREKDVTLAFALGLRRMIEKTLDVDVFLTREDDRFLQLDERVRIARQHGADLFISIHADTIRYRSIRGATVYTISDKASDAVAEAAADRENLADAVAGIEISEDNQQIADILVDLMRRETHGFSVGFARSLIGEMSKAVELIKNPHRHAGFRVLRAPDVPSVLVELGYLSNTEDEALLLDEEWRRKAFASMSEAISRFVALKKGVGG